MGVYPVNLELGEKRCAVVGGGAVALRKTAALLEAGAAVTVISPRLTEGLAALAEAGRIHHQPQLYAPGDLTGFFLVIAAADDPEANRRAAAEARSAGALVSVADGGAPSDFFAPAQVRRGALLLTVSTGGKSPALARQIRAELEARYGDEYGVCLEMLARLRGELKAALPESAARVSVWRRAMGGEILALVEEGKIEQAEAEIRNAIGGFRAES